MDKAEMRSRFDAWMQEHPGYLIYGFNRREDMWDAWRAAALAPPKGFALVPVKPPTQEMWALIRGDGLAGIDRSDSDTPEAERYEHLGWFLLAWPELLSMLAARPEAGNEE